ncbi:TonB-dependent receptor plug domain-containing protein [Rhizorhabdus phycosphaerae]|uniref:TonB-dependent receptor plug domain-containing protein n=1 Tax=Rhizorhabdus phycosphaerae TaxID=2711156 RepID=UPI0013EA2E72|nr:TonB-dependent receptor [Rhizorhabdus phycosphaerae]
MSRISILHTLLFATAVVPTAAHADAAGEDADTIVVTATRTDTPLSQVAQSISVVDARALELRQTPSVAELLRTLPGVTIVRNGGLGSTTSVFIRGAESDQTVALIDGVKLNDPSAPGGGFNFADLLTDNLDRIEVLRGAQSVLWGSQAIGGVVNLITSAPTQALQIKASGEYGRYDAGRAVANVSGTVGPVALSAGAGYLTTNGISVADRSGGGSEPDGYHLFGAHAKAQVTLADDLSLDLRGFYTKSKVDLDGFPPPDFSLGDTDEYARQEQIVGYAGLNAGLFDGRLKNRLAVAWTRIDRQNYDPAGTPVLTFDAVGRNLRFEYQGGAQLADWVDATFGAEHEGQRYRTESIYSPLDHRKANIDSVYGLLTLRPVSGLTAAAGLRHDDHSQFGGKSSANASLVWTPNRGATVLRATYSEGFKAPSLYQLYGDFGFDKLRPEEAKSWDAGIEQSLIGDLLQVRATWFERRVTNQIDFDLNSYTYANIARARARGAELELVMHPTAGFEVRANYTYTKAQNRERSSANFGNSLPRRPRNAVSVTADYAWSKGSVGATVTHVSNSFDNAANSTRLQGYALVDIRASFPLNESIELYGRIENLFDERYQTASGYGQPGRAATAGARLRY